MNAYSLKCALYIIQSLKSDAFDLKSPSMHSHKPFQTHGTQNIFFNSKHLTQLEDFINMVSFLLHSYYVTGTHGWIAYSCMHLLVCTMCSQLHHFTLESLHFNLWTLEWSLFNKIKRWIVMLKVLSWSPRGCSHCPELRYFSWVTSCSPSNKMRGNLGTHAHVIVLVLHVEICTCISMSTKCMTKCNVCLFICYLCYL